MENLCQCWFFYLEFIYTSCTTYSLYLFFRSLAQSTSYARELVDYSLHCARGLLWPPCTFTFPTTLGDLSTSLYVVLKDCADHRSRLRSQPRSGTCLPVSTPCSGTVLTTEHVYVPNHAPALVDQSLCRARGLCWLPIVLGDSSITPCVVLRTCFDHSPTTTWGLLFSVTYELD